MKSYIITFIIMFIFTLPVYGQHTHDHHTYRSKADVQYTIRADIKLDSAFVSGTVELEIKNRFESIDEIKLYLPLNEYVHGSLLEARYLQVLDSSVYLLAAESDIYTTLDSISFRGVPIAESEIVYQNAIMTVRLPQPILTGEVGYIFVSFKSKVPQRFDEAHDFQVYSNWFPELLYFDSSGWAEYPFFGWNEPLKPFADYAVSLTVDSSYDIAFTGDLINEREHFGFHNIVNDTILYDILSDSLKSTDSKQYHVRKNDSRKFSFSVLRGYRQDRIVYNGFSVEVIFPDSGFALEDTVTHVISEILSMAIPLLPYEQVTLLFIDTVLLETTSNPLIIIPSDFDNIDHVKGFLLVALTNLTIPPVYSEGNKRVSYWEKGLAYYICSELAYELYGAEGISQLTKLEKYLKKKTTFLRLYKNDLKLFNLYDKPVAINNELIRVDITNLNNFVVQSFREIPSKLASYMFIVGDSEIRSRLKTILRLPKNRYVAESEIFNLLFSEDGWMFASGSNSGLMDIKTVDFSLKDTKYTYHGDSTTITASIVQQGNISYPVEIGFISTYQDTIFDTIRVAELKTGQFNLEKTVPFRIQAVSLDPHYFYPDTNRFDNNHSRVPKKIRTVAPKSYFLGYRKF